ncbi:S-adenosyl-L-methionine-dependent methyltransferase [Rhypophila decipiens]|uniref:S-adenosyl-L-methionine-dependent methyltransferase n=1 Tax=Rhypophila decipiens TaxID=261697 RepID=A0AAN6Y757_9PEZI|nr:S-adenosyl-L-methionine-dependent methyltransferase [Rhypophila decipiens]
MSNGSNKTFNRDQQFGHAEYWDERYKDSDGSAPTHEWLLSFVDLEPFLKTNLFDVPGLRSQDDPHPLVLHLGSGDSTIPIDLSRLGYTSQICADFSPTVVCLMREQHASFPGIEWRLLDLRDMQGIPPNSIDVAFDKSTLDAMIYGSPWSPPPEVKKNTGAYLQEVHRVLKPTGRFLCITFRQPHFMKPLLSQGGLFDLDMKVLNERGSFNYYGYISRKKSRSLSPTTSTSTSSSTSAPASTPPAIPISGVSDDAGAQEE